MKKFLFSVMMAMSSIASFAYDFKVDGIYYNITSASKMTVEVTYGPNRANSNGSDYDLKNIVVPANVNYNGSQYAVTGIGRDAFSRLSYYDFKYINSNLLSISLPNSIIYIDEYAFYYCISLTHITLPPNLEKIGHYAFGDSNKILSMIIPANVNTIGCYALPKSVKELIMLPYNPPSGFDSYSNCGAQDAEVLVLSKNKYFNDEKWNKYNIIEMLSPNSKEFEYTGQAPVVEWTNNLSGYTMNVSSVTLQKNAGSHSTEVKADFYKDDDLEFSVEFPYEYTINKAHLTAKANNASREYGESNPLFNFTYSGFLGDDNESEIITQPTISTTATKTSNVGEYPINISGGSSTNYELVFEPGVLTITKAPLSAKVKDAEKVYGTQNPTFSIQYNGLKNKETSPTWATRPAFQTDATKSSNVGLYEVKAENGVPVNYNLDNITSGTLNITPAPLTIKANDVNKQYYEENPQLTYSFSGFVNGDDESKLSVKPEISTSAVQTSGVGTYEIKVSNAEDKNYSISNVSGTLTVTPRTLLASVGNYERYYNEENPTFEVKYDGFAGNEDESVLNSKVVASTQATKSSDVGTYPINITGGSADNYKFFYNSGMLTINKAEQTVSWNQDLSNLIIGDQIELKAVASSGLPVTYTVTCNDIAAIYTTGNRTYLDCFGLGELQIMAVQEGNQNYYSSQRVRKFVTIDSEDAISTVAESNITIQGTSYGARVIGANKGDVIRIYTTDGSLYHSVKAEQQVVDVPLKKDNVYIIKIGTQTMKLSH